MGQRITIVMGIGLLLCLACLPAYGQDKKPPTTPKEDPAAAPPPQVSPGDPIEALPPPDELPPPAAVAEPPAGAARKFPPVEPEPLPQADAPLPAIPKARGTSPDKPAPGKEALDDDRPLQDQDVIKIEGAANPADSHPAPAPATTPPVASAANPAAPVPSASASVAAEGGLEGSNYLLPADRLPLGKQEVVVSVEVQAPANLVYNRESTVKLVVRNSGSSDAQGVVVRDQLPPGLEYVSAQPEAVKVDSLLSWRISTLQAGAERVILLKVKPSKQGGALDHSATVSFLAGSKATSRVLRPRLKIEVVQTPAEGKVLKNKSTEFRISITNTGDGPARNVTVQAKLSPGLRHETGEHNEDNSFELPIQELGPGQREDLDPLTVDAVQGGAQWCKVSAVSPDVDFDKDTAEISRKVDVVEPKLKMTLTGPDKRYTDTIAPYAITLENPGTAPARNIKILATLGVSGRLVAVPPGAKYDSASRRLQWTLPQLDPNEKPATFPFEVRMGGISAYEINVEARGDNALYVKDRRITDVQGMPDVDLLVRERRRVVDVDGTTTFYVRLRNYGTKEATNLQVSTRVSENLYITELAGGPSSDGKATASEKHDEAMWPTIPKLGPGKEMMLEVKVKVTQPQPKIGTCRVFLWHEDLPKGERLEDMAGVKVQESRRAAVTGP